MKTGKHMISEEEREQIVETAMDLSDAAFETEELPEDTASLSDSSLYLNRLLSHLQFNLRVLQQAVMTEHPLMERLKFLLIFSANTDEFFEIRVAQLKSQIKFSREYSDADGMHPRDVLREVSDICHMLVDTQYSMLNNILLPALEEEGICFLRREQWNKDQEDWIYNYFKAEIQPVVSPIGLDPAHPFPRLVNKSLNFIVELDGKDAFGRESGLAIIPAPRSLPRLIQLPADVGGGPNAFVFLSSIIHNYADRLFPGMTIDGCYQFRITRNADLNLESDEVDDLARAMRGELHSRRYGDAVRLETAENCPEELVEALLRQFDLTESECYRVNGPVNLTRMFSITRLEQLSQLSYTPFTPGVPKLLQRADNIFDAIRKSDILLHHPFESFTPVVDLIRQSAKDPNVLAIRQTLYRTGADSEIVSALVDAARAGTEVTAVIEIRARFDEEENLTLASRLQEAGAVVCYGVVSFKTHSKMMLVVRREQGELRRYAHLGTGNYHALNARLYTDYSLLTCDTTTTNDVHKLFMQLTGMGRAMRVKEVLHAPFTLHKQILEMIKREATHATQGKPARIIIKVNGLTEPKVIRALYRAGQAGVQVDLIVRGMCCLRPGIPGVSENIRVRSVVGRYLEHSRAMWFANDDKPQVYLSSADLMERNLLRRVETCFPVKNEKLAARLLQELELYLADNCQSWELGADGKYDLNRPAEGEERICAQARLLADLAV